MSDKTELQNAVQAGDLHRVRELLHKRKNLAKKKVSKRKTTVLHHAAGKGHAEIVKCLLLADYSSNQQDEEGNTPLHWAARGGHLPVARALSSAGCDVMKQNDEGRTPVEVALEVHDESSQIVAFLRDAERKFRKAQVLWDQIDEEVKEKKAKKKGSIKKSGSKDNLRSIVSSSLMKRSKSNEDMAGLESDGSLSDDDILSFEEILNMDPKGPPSRKVSTISQGPPSEPSSIRGSFATNEEPPRSPKPAPPSYAPPLRPSLRASTPDLDEGRMRSESQPPMRSDDLSLAVLPGETKDRSRSEAALLDPPALPAAPVPAVPPSSRASISSASSSIAPMSDERERAASTATQSPPPSTPPPNDSPASDKHKSVHAALLREKRPRPGSMVASVVIPRNSIASAPSPGRAPSPPPPPRPEDVMFECAGKGDAEGVVRCIKEGVGADIRDERGWTPLMVASGVPSLDVVRILVSVGASVNASSSDGRTPLMIAACAGAVDVVNALLDAGAISLLREAEGRTAYGLALAQGAAAVVEAFERRLLTPLLALDDCLAGILQRIIAAVGAMLARIKVVTGGGSKPIPADMEFAAALVDVVTTTREFIVTMTGTLLGLSCPSAPEVTALVANSTRRIDGVLDVIAKGVVGKPADPFVAVIGAMVKEVRRALFIYLEAAAEERARGARPSTSA